MLEQAAQTGAELRTWRRRLGWTEAMAAAWYGCTYQAWQKWERLDYLPLPLIRRVQDFEWVRAQGYSPSRRLRPRGRR